MLHYPHLMASQIITCNHFIQTFGRIRLASVLILCLDIYISMFYLNLNCAPGKVSDHINGSSAEKLQVRFAANFNLKIKHCDSQHLLSIIDAVLLVHSQQKYISME